MARPGSTQTARPYADGDTAWVPVRENEPYDRELPERRRYKGRGFFVAGNVAVIHGKKPDRAEVEEIVNFRHPEGVLWIESIFDVTRTPRTEVIWGEVGEVEHHENGYAYIFDPRKVMFSPGNRIEKMRMAHLVSQSDAPERVADMFAGIGYFSVPMAGSGARVHAIEINPVAFGYLVRTIERNGLSDRIAPFPGDCRDLLTGTTTGLSWGISMQQRCFHPHSTMPGLVRWSMSTASARPKTGSGRLLKDQVFVRLSAYIE